MDFQAGLSAHLSIKFGAGADPVIPDTGSVSYSVLSHSGSVIEGFEDLPLTTDATTWQAKITIPDTANTIASGKSFERRTVVLTYDVDSVTYTQSYQYRVIPFVNFSVTPQQVRGFIGVTEEELEDDDIDLFAAYLKVVDDFGTASLDTILASGTTQELSANEAIRMRAVIDVLGSIRNRIAQSESNGNLTFSRPKIVDFQALLDEATARYGAAIVAATGVSEVIQTLIVTTTDADPITG